MCGISAIFRYTQITEQDIQKLHLMNEEMYYRGPDDRGVWYDGQCGMAQVRLSIIGLEKGKQPLFNEDQSIVLVCNGEIYNYVELKQKLKDNGHYFNSDSDSETILHLYEDHGVKCVDYLRGMFAFCLWDSKNKRLFAARDRIGEKPLYFAQVPSGVVFSSELKAILKNFIESPQINIERLAEPIRYTAPLDKVNTFIEQIVRLAPGHFVIIDDRGLRKYRYWKRDTTPKFNGTFELAKAETLNLMRESVDMCLRSDVPVAVMLSGGIDSSAIATLAKASGREVHTITAGYKGQHDCDERDVAYRFAKEKGFIYHEIELDEEDFMDCFEELTLHIDEPITDAAAIAQWALYRKVKSLGFKVLLGGMGGDELFYGYPYWNSVSESLGIQRKHQAMFPWNSWQKKLSYLDFFAHNWKYMLKSGHPMKIADSSINYWHYNDYYKFAKNASLCYQDNESLFSDVNLYKSWGNVPTGSEIDLVYEFSFDNIMTMAYLYLGDRLGMGNSLEIRSPFLDYKLVNFISGLPISFKYRINQPKYFLKEVLKDIIPDYILNAPKRGFSPPVGFIKEISSYYDYKFIKADHCFYNSILADRVLFNCLIKNYGHK